MNKNGLRLFTLGFLALHVYHANFQGGGGWRERHGGFWGAIVAFFRLSLKDPVMSAGLSDFTVVAVVFGTKTIHALPPAERWTWKTKVWLLVYTVFPGLGALLAPLWFKPAAR